MWQDFYPSVDCLTGESKCYQSWLCEAKITTSRNKALCVGYFSIAVIKTHGQKQLRKREFGLVYSSRGIKIRHGRVEAWQQATGKIRKVRVQIFSRKMRQNFGTGSRVSLQTLKILPSNIVPPAWSHLLNLPDRPSSSYLVFKCLRLWNISHFSRHAWVQRTTTHAGIFIFQHVKLGGTL